MKVLLLVLGGFLLGGAYSVWRHPDRGQRGVLLALVLLVAAVVATVAGVLRLRS